MLNTPRSDSKSAVRIEFTMKMPPTRFLIHFMWGYVAICLALLIGKPMWYIVGTFLGMIIVLTVCQYFYDNIIVPYNKELKSEGGLVVTGRNSLMVWMLEWILPAIFIQVIIVFGFKLTIEGSPFKNTAFTHPYKYGEIYVQYTQINKIYDDKLQNSARNKGVSDYKEEVTNKRDLLKEDFKEYLNSRENEALDKGKQSIEMTISKIPYLIALTFGFLGTLLYILNDHIFRYYTGDLYPKTLVGYIVRFIFAPALCLVIAYYTMNNWWVNAAPAVFLAIGFFPQRAMLYLEDKAFQLLIVTVNK